MALEIENVWWLEVADAMRLEGISRMEVYNRMKPGDVHPLIWKDRREIDGKPGRLIYWKSASFAAQQRWRQELLKQAAGSPIPAAPANSSNSNEQIYDYPTPAAISAETQGEPPPQRDLFTLSLAERLVMVLPTANQRKVAFARFSSLQPLFNGDWKSQGYPSRLALVREISKSERNSQKTIWRRYQNFKATISPEFPDGDVRALIDKRPGPEATGPGSGSPGFEATLDLSMCAFIRLCWERDRLTKEQSYQKLKNYLNAKQRGVGAGYLYDIPSKRTVTRFINERLQGEASPYRNPDGIKNAVAPILRHYRDEYAGDAWCIDEWELDGVFYDDQRHRQLINYGKHSYIAHILTILDERTTCILGMRLTLSLCADEVLALAERVVREHGVPLQFVSDRGGHFRQRVIGRVVVESNGVLVEKLTGPLGRLGIRARSPREKNPRGNRLERLHRVYADLARRDFSVSWRGANTTEREITDIDNRVKQHLVDHCRHGNLPAQLLSIQQAEKITGAWQDEINLAETEAKGCNGLTRLAAYRQFQPPAEERTRRRPSEQLLEQAFAEYFEDITIKPGGVLELPRGEGIYENPLLGRFQGDCRLVARLRNDKSAVVVLPDAKGEETVVAARVTPVGTRDAVALADAYARQTRLRNVFAQFAERLEAPAEAESGIRCEISKPQYPEISSSEWMMTHGRAEAEPVRRSLTSEEIANRALELEEAL